jgi:hypothetical protein
MKKLMLLIAFPIFCNVCSAQSKKVFVYLYFETACNETCKGNDGQDYKKFSKQDILGVLVFKICSQEFGFEIKEGIKDIISLDQKKEYNLFWYRLSTSSI